MNKILFPNGGAPLYGDDFGFLDTAQRDAFKGIAYEIAKLYNGNLILGGCEVSVAGANFTVAEGYVMIGYEVCYFPGFTGPVAGGAYGYFSLSTTYDSGGQKVFANASTQQTWQVRRATFTPNVLSGGALDTTEVKRLSDGLEALISSKIISSTSFTMINGWAKVTANNPTLYKHLKNVTLIGDFTVGTLASNSWTKITTLPVGFRPIQRIKSLQPVLNSAPEFGSVMIEVFQNGEVYAINTGSQTWDLSTFSLCFTAA